MKKCIFILFLCAVFFPAWGQDPGADGLLGVQWTGPKRQSRIEFFRSQVNSGLFYARIMWVAPDQPQTDRRNPDRSLRSRPLDGLVVADSIVYRGNNQWSTEQMYLPEEGMRVKALITLVARDTIDIRGTKFGISKTSVMTRVEASDR